MDEQIFKGLMMLGDERIDREHNEFFDMMKKLDTDETAKESSFITLIKEILRHLMQHFQYEVELMRQFQYSNTYQHVQEHEDIIGYLNDIVLADYEPGLSEHSAKEVIKRWGFKHFLQADKEFIEYIHRLKRSTKFH